MKFAARSARDCSYDATASTSPCSLVTSFASSGKSEQGESVRARAQGSSTGNHEGQGALRLSLLLAAMALFALVFASGAHAVTYSPGAPLLTEQLTTSVAVDQSSRDLYVSSVSK